MKSSEKKNGLSESFVVGIIAIVFLIVGYQTALFVHRAAVVKVVANRDEPDTVFVFRSGEVVEEVIQHAEHFDRAESIRAKAQRKKIESFRFDPNTVSVEDLVRLGFSPKQAQSIENYRKKGGRFRRKDDFAKSFVVSDTIFKRLEPYIDIPLVDLNTADSTAFDSLPGIGGWFASRMVSYRNELRGYSYKEQLMEIYRFDEQKFDALSDLVTISPEHLTPYPLWSLSADSLRQHPYIANYETARAIVLFRENTPKSQWTVEALHSSGILDADVASRLSRCCILEP